jgi:hypothetical protein
MNEFFLRTESIRLEKISELSVTNSSDRIIINALKSSEPCLLEGARGTGKSFLMRMAEQEIEKSDDQAICIFISFSQSSLIDTIDPLQFYHWMLAKLLKAFITKLKKKGLSISSFSANLLSNDSTLDENTISVNLKELVTRFESSYENNTLEIDTSKLPDIEDVKEAIEEICQQNALEKVYFFFDEAAHVFRPAQQRQFFNLFKDLRSPYIVCNAAIYPGVTYFGSSFEITHDCIYKKLERNIKDSDYLNYFKEIVYKQADNTLKATDTYAFFQSKSIKQAIAEGQRDDYVARGDKAKAEKLDAKIARYESEPDKGEGKKELLAKAQSYEKARDDASKHTPWLTFASMAFQLAIVLLSASILAVNNKMYKGSLYVAVAGMVLLSQGIWLWF